MDDPAAGKYAAADAAAPSHGFDNGVNSGSDTRRCMTRTRV